MPALTVAEKVELAAIPAGIAVTAWLAPRAGLRLDLGEWLAGGALLLLVQGFFRDLWLLREAKRHPAATPARAASCMCVESALGLTGIAAGIGLVGLGLMRPVLLGVAGLVATVGAVMTGGFLLKDFVFAWSPWKIYREKNHAQLTFRWRQ
jgi:hypothetical protein